MQSKIQVLMLAPGKEPCQAEISTSKYTLRHAVNLGSDHQCKAACRRIENDICVLFNHGLSFEGFTPNRRIADDILCGTVYIAGIQSDRKLRSLTDEEMQKYASMYQVPETYSFDEAQSANLTDTYNVQVKGMESRDVKFVYG